MNWLGEQLLGYGRIFQPREVKRRLREVTAGEKVVSLRFHCARRGVSLAASNATHF
jgi:hypothetical protein